MGILNAVRAGLEEGAKRIKAYHSSENFNPQLAGRHPSDNADMSALQLVPHMAKGLINDVVKYGSQAATGEISDGDFLQQQPLTGQAKTIADAAGSAMGTALNYKVPSLLRGPRSAMDDIQMVVDAYQGVRPGIVDAIGESSVNRVEGAGLLGSMFIPAKVPKPKSGGLFSQAVIASDNLQRKTGNADGFFNDLTGKGQVKPDELNAMGFKENFAGRNDVSRQEVQQFVNDNQVQIKETRLGMPLQDRYVVKNDPEGGFNIYDSTDPSEEILDRYGRQETAMSAAATMNMNENVNTSKFGSYTLDGGDNYREILLQDNSSAGLLDELNLLNGQMGEIKTPLLRNVTSDDALKKRYSDATIFGDMEIDEFVANEIPEYAALLSRRDELVKQKNNLPEPFINSSHFDEPNILAHLRMKDRVDADGNKTLLLEEVQSDLHQQGAESGYKKSAQSSNEINAKVDEFVSAYPDPLKPEIKKALDTITGGNDLDSDAWGVINKHRQFEPFDANEFHDLLFEARQANLNKVPDAPFKTDDKSSWYNLALKRGLLEAVEGGYDKLALTTGRQQAERYDLSNQIGSMRLREEIIPNNKASGGDPLGSRKMFLLDAFDLDGNKVINRRIDNPEKELPNIIGKEVSKKLLNQEAGVLYPDVPSSTAKVKILNGLDLSVGGEGMKQFYDRTLPNALGKLVKQDGVKVSESNLIGKTPSKTEIASASDREELITLRDKIFNGDDTSPTHDRYNELLAKYQPKPRTDAVHSIDITPKMRERVKKGLPLFATGGAAIGLGELMRQQQQEKEAGSGLLHSL